VNQLRRAIRSVRRWDDSLFAIWLAAAVFVVLFAWFVSAERWSGVFALVCGAVGGGIGLRLRYRRRSRSDRVRALS